MVATATIHHLFARSERRMVEYDSDDALNLVDLSLPQGGSTELLPVVQFRRFVAGLIRTVGTSTVSAFSIVAATSAAGAGVTAVVSHALGSAPDAINDQLWLETTIEQVREVVSRATHVGIQVQLATASDEAIFYFERTEPRHPRADLTTDFIG